MLSGILRLYGRSPYHPGKWRIIRVALDRFPGLRMFRGVIKRSGFLLNVDCSVDDVDCRLTYLGVYEPFEISAMRRFVKDGDCILDVGANTGYLTLWFGRTAGIAGRVYSFEPFPSTFEKLAENIWLNGMSNVTAVKKAVSDKNGMAQCIAGEFSGMCRVVAAGADRRDAQVETVTVDTFARERGLDTIDFIKIDVEGMERFVLRGAERTIEKCRPKLMVEVSPANLERYGCSPEDLLSAIRKMNYRLFVPRRYGLERLSSFSAIKGNEHINLLAIPGAAKCRR